MKQIIKRVTAVPLKVRASHAQYGFKQTHDSSMCHVEVESAGDPKRWLAVTR